MSTIPTDIAEEAELHDAPGGKQLRLRFNGPFEGHLVMWDATIIALSPGLSRNFIDIGEATEAGIALTVGLNVMTIDLPTIRKTMMMIRQYKRLQRGRHEYGPTSQKT